MNNHLDEMKLFLEVVQSYSNTILFENNVQPNIIKTEEKENVVNENIDLMNDLVELKEALLSITSDENDEVFAMGYEKGLYKAVELLEGLLSTKYNRRI